MQDHGHLCYEAYSNTQLYFVLLVTEDSIALYDIKILQFPERLWFESLEYVDFELCVTNKGPSIPSPALAFKMSLLFSAFDDVSQAEPEEYKVYTDTNYVFDYTGGLEHDQVYCTGPLQGELVQPAFTYD